MNPELEQHLLMVRDKLEEMEDTDAREAAMNLLDALETINKNFENATPMLNAEGKVVRGMNFASLQIPMSSALEEIVDAPLPCRYMISGGRAYGPTPEPDEYCGKWAVPCEEFCEEHL